MNYLQLSQKFLFYYQNTFYLKIQTYLKLFFNINNFMKNFMNFQHNFIILGSNYFYNTLQYKFKSSNFNSLITANKINFSNISFFKHKFITSQLKLSTLMMDLNFKEQIKRPLELPLISYNNSDYLLPFKINGIFAFYFFIKYLLKSCF